LIPYPDFNWRCMYVFIFFHALKISPVPQPWKLFKTEFVY
jgi:hypothetical protein